MSASSQYLDTLTRLTQAGAAAQAEGIRARAAATAEAQRANGQIWGQTLGNLGQYIGQIPQQQAEMQRIKLQAQTQQMQADALKRAQAGEQMANQVIASLPKTADGMWDTDAITQKLAASNVPLPEQEKLLSSIDGLNKIKESVNTAKRNHTAELADFILGQHASSEPVTPEAVQLGVAAAKDLGLATDQDQQQFTQALSQPGADPEQLLKRVRSLGDKYKASYEPLPSNSPGVLNKATGEVTTTGITAKPKTWAEMGLDAQDPNSPTAAASQAALDAHEKVKNRIVAPGSFEDFVIKKYGPNATPEQILAARGDYGRADDKIAGQQAADITNLTPAGIDMAALNYRKTGQLPPLGMGDRTTRQKILNRAAELTPTDIQRIEAGGTDVAGNRAAYRADTGSFATLQKQRDAIGAFENTAQKNIDNFLAVAKKVPDTGIPLLNSPVRWIAGAGGSADVAKYNAARQVAVSEIAKIVQNPNLSGNLSDSARKEIEAFNPSDATLGQTIAVMNLLKQDMSNRKTSVDQQLKEIRGRIGGAQPAAAPAATPAAIPGFSYQDYLKSRQP